MNIRLDPARLSAGADALDARADDMVTRRAHLEASVDALLAGWQGDAADRFARLWEAWRTCADEVIADLCAGASALRLARDDLCAADVSASQTHDLLSGRLG